MLRHLLPGVLIALCVSPLACSRPAPPGNVRGNSRVQGHYDPKTGKLLSITYDSNNNGKIDTWSYMDGARVIRIEIDKDEDGKVDRWEYYTPDQKLEKVGWSRAGNGKPDAWAYQGPDGKIAKVELAALAQAAIPDGAPATPKLAEGQASPQGERRRVARIEFYENGVLARVEEDANGDGRIDKWETWRDGSIASVAFDTTGRGTPGRRLVYGPRGSVTVEVDPAGTGQFHPVRK